MMKIKDITVIPHVKIFVKIFVKSKRFSFLLKNKAKIMGKIIQFTDKGKNPEIKFYLFSP